MSSVVAVTSASFRAASACSLWPGPFRLPAILLMRSGCREGALRADFLPLPTYQNYLHNFIVGFKIGHLKFWNSSDLESHNNI